MRRRALAPIVAALAAAALLSGAAAYTVQQAGCDNPGHYVQQRDGGYELVGGCLEPGDLPVGPVPAVESEHENDSTRP